MPEYFLLVKQIHQGAEATVTNGFHYVKHLHGINLEIITETTLDSNSLSKNKSYNQVHKRNPEQSLNIMASLLYFKSGRCSTLIIS